VEGGKMEINDLVEGGKMKKKNPFYEPSFYEPS
jgi:hypothetical protein